MHKTSYSFNVSKVKEVMTFLKLTQAMLAAQLHTSQPTVQRTITNETANRMAQITIADFLVRAARRKRWRLTIEDLLEVQDEQSSAA